MPIPLLGGILIFGILHIQIAVGHSGNNVTQDERALGAFLQRVAVGRAMTCQSDNDCGRNNKCLADKMNLCGRPSVATVFQSADDKVCKSDSDCQTLAGSKKLASRCNAGKCDLCGPRVCITDTDCCSSAHGEGQKCAKLAGYNDKRCWKSCAKKDDCPATFGNARGKLFVCVDSVCQKRNRKPKKSWPRSTTSAPTV